MKKTDIAMIILIASVSVLAAYFIASSIPFFSDDDKPVKVKTAETITSDINEVDKTIFNKNAVNPTVEVTIGSGSSQQEASGSTESTESSAVKVED